MSSRAEKAFSLATNVNDGVVKVAVGALEPFPEHPFRVETDTREFEGLCNSVVLNGIITPLIVRKSPGSPGKYQIISGHRRTEAAKKEGLKEVPAIIRDLDDDEAIIAMVDSNKARENMLVSEIAWSCKMKMDALNRQGKRTDLTSGHNVQKLDEEKDLPSGHNVQKLARDIVGEEIGMTGRTVSRYIKLTELDEGLLKLIDEGRVPFTAGEPLTAIDKPGQRLIAEYLAANEKKKMTAAHAEALREYDIPAGEGPLTKEAVQAVFEGEKKEKKATLPIDLAKVEGCLAAVGFDTEKLDKKQKQYHVHRVLEMWVKVITGNSEEAEKAITGEKERIKTSIVGGLPKPPGL